MRPIGCTLACVLFLVVATFSKSAIARSAESVAVASGIRYEVGRAKVTKLLPIFNLATLDPDISEPRTFLDELFGGASDSRERTSREARTFGHKRIQFMLMPMMYKMGAMMTMLTVLIVISLKGLLIGAILLMLKLSTIIANFTSGWQHNAHPAQPIHVHVHNGLPTGHNQAYSGWMPHSGPEDGEHYYYRG